MIKAPLQDIVDAQFAGTNFGPEGETPQGRIALVAKCVMQRACGFAAGGTITTICRDLNMLTPGNTPRLWAKRWAFQVTMGSLRPNTNLSGAASASARKTGSAGETI